MLKLKKKYLIGFGTFLSKYKDKDKKIGEIYDFFIPNIFMPYAEDGIKIFEKYVRKDNEGNPVEVTEGDQSGYEIIDSMIEDYNNEMSQLGEEETEIIKDFDWDYVLNVLEDSEELFETKNEDSLEEKLAKQRFKLDSVEWRNFLRNKGI